MHGREDMGVTNIIPFGFRTIVATLLNWFHSWYIPHPIKVHRDNYLADTIAKAKMWTMMVNHAKFPKNPELKTLDKNDELKIIWHSRLSGEKRIMTLLEALRLLGGTNKTKKSSKFMLDIYGNGGDLNRAKKFVKKHKINANFHGNIPFEKLSTSITNSHLDVLVSSNFDTFGMTLIEAEAHGVPVLFCDPDMKEIVPPESYILSKTDSPESIAEALNNLLDHPEKIQQMSKIMLEHRTEVLISKRIKISLLLNIIKTQKLLMTQQLN